jgi:hypothetical protein
MKLRKRLFEATWIVICIIGVFLAIAYAQRLKTPGSVNAVHINTSEPDAALTQHWADETAFPIEPGQKAVFLFPPAWATAQGAYMHAWVGIPRDLKCVDGNLYRITPVKIEQVTRDPKRQACR